MNQAYQLGIQGEQIAVEYLTLSGVKILETNWRAGNNEVDIIGTENNTLLIIEVKTRTYDNIAAPYTAVNKTKQNILIRAANLYIMRNNWQGETRFDIISIVIENNKPPRIEHIKDAFYPRIK
jgi:putative endonuclease